MLLDIYSTIVHQAGVSLDGWTLLSVCVHVLVVTLVTYVIYLMFSPVNSRKDLCTVGYNHILDGNKSSSERKSIVNQLRRRRKIGDLPPVFPNGWFAILETEDLKPGQSKSVDVLGENLAVFRSETGKIRVLDAYCPHLGANLGVGGRVFGDCIECPFHGWKFSGETGACTEIPYEKKVPSLAKVRTWQACETNGYIFIWYHAEGEAPSWEIPKVDEVNSGAWKYRGRTEHLVNCHIQEVPENGADVAHLGQIHEPMVVAGNDLRKMWSYLFVQHKWEATWERSTVPGQEHTTNILVNHDLEFFRKFRFDSTRAVVKVNQIGPGLVHLVGQTLMGKFIFIQTVTPVGALTQRVVHRMYTQPSIIQPIASILLLAEQVQVERDMQVWNNKTFKKAPVMVAKDEQIKKYRQWFKQFYSENSPTLSFQKDGLEW